MFEGMLIGAHFGEMLDLIIVFYFLVLVLCEETAKAPSFSTNRSWTFTAAKRINQPPTFPSHEQKVISQTPHPQHQSSTLVRLLRRELLKHRRSRSIFGASAPIPGVRSYHSRNQILDPRKVSLFNVE